MAAEMGRLLVPVTASGAFCGEAALECGEFSPLFMAGLVPPLFAATSRGVEIGDPTSSGSDRTTQDKELAALHNAARKKAGLGCAKS